MMQSGMMMSSVRAALSRSARLSTVSPSAISHAKTSLAPAPTSLAPWSFARLVHVHANAGSPVWRPRASLATTVASKKMNLAGTSAVRFFSSSAKNGKAGASTSSSYQDEIRRKNTTGLVYILAIVVAAIGVSYCAVPLYKVFCQVTGYGGTTRQSTLDIAKKMQPVPGAAPITVRFTAQTAASLDWKFKPQQSEITVVPGETALAFYTATNKTSEPITGVASYNITPTKAGIYFNKIQCFCFDQQRLKPNEEVDMPVFFYIDPTFADDPQMAGVDNIVLSYTFFKAKN
mmetsp:Transcript_10339/g.20350  ORF Transcript_10339/g.20350 Transcript_10339/m.20350 type:complete len:289 (+) Transcript_10339:160-1026(+)